MRILIVFGTAQKLHDETRRSTEEQSSNDIEDDNQNLRDITLTISKLLPASSSPAGLQLLPSHRRAYLEWCTTGMHQPHSHTCEHADTPIYVYAYT